MNSEFEAGDLVSRLRSGRLFKILMGGLGLVCILFLGYTLASVWDELSQYTWDVHYPSLIVSFVAYALAASLGAFVWHLLIKHLGGISDLKKNIQYFSYSVLAKHIPGAIWFIAGRVYLYQQEGVSSFVTLTATGLEVVLATISGIAVYLITLPFLALPQQRAVPLLAIVAVVVPLVLLVIRPDILCKVINFVLRKLGRREITGSLGYKEMLAGFLAYVLGWAVGGVVLFGVTASVWYLEWGKLPIFVGLYALYGVVGLVSSFPLGGLGVKEVTLALLLKGSMPWSVAVVVSLLFRLWLIANEIVWAVVASGVSLMGKRVLSRLDKP